MGTFINRSVRLVLAAAVVLAVGASPLMGQTGGGGGGGGTKKKEVVLVAPTPPVGKSDTPWMPYGVAILLAGLIIGVNFIPSKRGHQD